VRISDSVLVFEAKIRFGFIGGLEAGPICTQHRQSARTETLCNPVQQNLLHVRAVERLVTDPAVCVRGFMGRFPT
jgi:hypothetical protein